MYRYLLKFLPIIGVFLTLHYHAVRFGFNAPINIIMFISYTLYSFMIIGCFSYLIKYKRSIKEKQSLLFYILVIFILYVIWGLFKFITGQEVMTKFQIFNQSISLLSFSFVFLFRSPDLFARFNSITIKYVPIVFLLIIFPFYDGSVYTLFFVGVTFWIMFYQYLSLNYKVILIAILIFSLFVWQGQRFPVVKIYGTLLLVLLNYKLYKLKAIMNIINGLFYIIPIVIVFLTATGIFNIFDIGKTTSIDYNGENLISMEGSRDFVYGEGVSSSISNNTYVFGNSPACGYNSEIFAKRYESNQLQVQRISEVFYLNIFTWMGIFGVLLFHIIFAFTSYTAINKSNNRFMPLVGLVISFNHFISWIGNSNPEIAISILYIYMMMGMSISSFFLNANDQQLSRYFKVVFGKEKYLNYKLKALYKATLFNNNKSNH